MRGRNSYMHGRKGYMRVFNILLTVAAYSYLVYRLVEFDGYGRMGETFQAAGEVGIIALLLSLLLMPVQVGCESWKWQTLLRHLHPMSIHEAQQQVYYGYVGAFVTPYRVGDYPTRMTLLPDKSQWASAVALGVVGSLAMLIVEICLGVPAMVMFVQYESVMPTQYMLITVGVIMLLLLFCPWCVRWGKKHRWQSGQVQRIFGELSQLTPRRVAEIVLQSLARYMIWAMQLILIFRFCGIELTPMQWLLTIPTYYLLLGVIPSLPVADIAVRGSLSIIIFGAFTPHTANIAVATTIIWVVNTILPMLVGSMVNMHLRGCQKPIIETK